MSQSKYVLIRAMTPEELEQRVNEALGQGYKLAGGVSIMAFDDEDMLFAQAMILKIKSDKTSFLNDSQDD